MPSSSSPTTDVVSRSVSRAGLGPGDLVVVALSGGVDSQTLTHALVTLRDRGDGPRLLAVHVDHQLRDESKQNALECQRVAAAIGIPFRMVSVDVAVWERGIGVEAAARRARYAALARVAQQEDARWVALGHTLDDQIETILLRLARGTSLDGLTAMREIGERRVVLSPSARGSFRLKLLRPLLSLRRVEIERYARDHDLQPIEDPSNIDTRFRRNAVRHRVLPLLEEVVPGTVASIARSNKLLIDDAEYLETLATVAFDQVCSRVGACIAIQRDLFRDLALPLERRVVVSAIHELSDHIDLTAERVEAVRQATVTGSVSTLVQIGNQFEGLVDYNRLVLGHSGDIEPELRAQSDLPLLNPGSVVQLDVSQRIQLANDWVLDIDLVGSADSWSLRTRRPGDRVGLDNRPLRNLQDWFVNQKVASYLRDYVPVLVRNGTIRWIAGYSALVHEDVDSRLVARLTRRTTDDQPNDEYLARHSTPQGAGAHSHPRGNPPGTRR